MVGKGARHGGIAAALADALPGDTVDVLIGEYREQLTLKSGVNLRSPVPREAILRAPPLGAGPSIYGEGVKNVRISGFLIQARRKAPSPRESCSIIRTWKWMTWSVSGAGTGIEIRGSGNVSLAGNAIHDCLREGVLIVGASTPWISHNSFQRNLAPAARAGRRAAVAGGECFREEQPGTAAGSFHGCSQRQEFPLGREAAGSGLATGRSSPAPVGGQEAMIAPASRKLGKYEILQKLGRGGMADVYLAQDSVLGHTVALKLIEHAADADTCDAIEAERRGSVLQAHLAAMDHRVAQVYDSGDVDGFFFVAMEYVDGQDLSELMRRGPLSPEFALDVAIAVAHTLENAHDLHVELGGKDFHGIVHGDIKPKNIRIDAHGEVRVLDFGIAKALSMSRRLTRNEFGSVPYGSPERLEAGEVNELSDLWSMTVMLYEMVTGMQPYHAESTERLERMIRSRIAPPPAPDPCPEPLRRILIKAMAPEAEERYQSAHDFREDLMAFRKGEPVRAIREDMDATRRTARGGEYDGWPWWGLAAGRPRPAAGQSSDSVSDDTRPTGGSAADQGPAPQTMTIRGGRGRTKPPGEPIGSNVAPDGDTPKLQWFGGRTPKRKHPGEGH